MITIIEILLVMFLFSKHYIAASLWVMSVVLLQMSYERGNEHIYLEVIEDYPIQHCVKPRKLKILFKKLNRLSYKDIPREMYYSEIIKICGFVIYSLALLVTIFVNEYVASVMGAVYIGFISVLSIFSGLRMKKRSFLERYKILNKHNIKYMFLPENEPYPREFGKCQIISESRRGKRTFVTVIVLETGEVKERVLLQGKKKQGDNPIYSIYEICKVYYIV